MRGRWHGIAVTDEVYMKNQNKSIKLFVAFIITYVCLGFCMMINTTIYTVKNHLDAFDLPAQYKLIVCVILLVVFCPWLLLCSHYAKMEKVKAIRILSLILFLLISVCVVSTILPIILL